MVSDFWKNGPMCSTTGLENNCAIQFLRFVCFYLLIFFLNWFHVIRQPFYSKSETPFSKQFSLNFFFCFLCKGQQCLEICVNCYLNCVTPLFTPLEVKFSKYIFSKTYFSLRWNLKLVLRATFERYQGKESQIWKIRGFRNHNFAKSEYMTKWTLI